jgi:hypothetical protein
MKMAKKAQARNNARRALMDQQHAGATPDITEKSTNLELIRAYNWYNYAFTSDDAKKFVLDYLKSKKVAKKTIKKVTQIKPIDLQNIGWNCHILSSGGKLPEEIHKKVFNKLADLIDATAPPVEEDAVVEPVKVISIQERIENRAGNLIADLEDQIDIIITEGTNDFDATDWFRTQAIKPAIAKFISEYYTPLYSEVFDVLKGKDDDLRFAYRRWKKPALKRYMEFIKSILSACETASVVVKVSRKPRKKKEKPASVIVSKLKYKTEDADYGITSVKPTDLVGAQQVWVFNTKTRQLSVYNAMGPTGISVKGTTLIGYDEKTSITKTLRKPQDVLKRLNEGGKLVLRKIMDEVKCKEKVARGRINTDSILVRVAK